MHPVSRLALVAAAATGLAAAAAAQVAPIQLGENERAALNAAQSALQQRNYQLAAPAIETARSQARSGHARYLAAALELRLGLETGDLRAQSSAIEAMIESGAVPRERLAQLYKNQGALLLSAGKYDRAEASFTRWAEVEPNNPDALLALAEIKDDRKKVPEAVALIDRAIALRAASGQRAPESWYKRGLKHAVDNQLLPSSIKFSRDLVSAYPTPGNWRDALLLYRDVAQPDPAAQLDMLRLMRSTQALAGERDYETLAAALSSAGLPAESKAVLDEGVNAKMVDPAKPAFKDLLVSVGKRAAADKKALAGLQAKAAGAVDGAAALKAADATLAAGEHAKAAELYQIALQKGGVDADTVNQRLGIALALDGQRTPAEAALRQVSGARGPLAALWMLWLAQRA